MSKFVVAKLEIQIGIEVNDDVDDDEAIEIARKQFEEFRIKEYCHSYDATMIGLEHRDGRTVSDSEIQWSLSENIDTEDLRIE